IAVSPIATPISARRRSGFCTALATGGALISITHNPAAIMKAPSPAISIRYSGQCARRAARAAAHPDPGITPETAPDMSAGISLGMSAPGGEFGVQRHAPIDEQRDAVDVIAVVGGQPARGAGDVVGPADPLVRHHPHQRLVSLRGGPRGSIDRGARRAGGDAVDPDAAR